MAAEIAIQTRVLGENEEHVLKIDTRAEENAPISGRNWLVSLRRYFIVSAIGNLAWEFLHLPLYTIWTDSPFRENAFAAVHCTAGDLLIASSTLILSLLALGRHDWPQQGVRPVIAATMTMGIAYTIFSEWLNIDVRSAWAYREVMPVMPWLGTGLSPLLQWLVVPGMAFWWALRPVASLNDETR